MNVIFSRVIEQKENLDNIENKKGENLVPVHLLNAILSSPCTARQQVFIMMDPRALNELSFSKFKLLILTFMF